MSEITRRQFTLAAGGTIAASIVPAAAAGSSTTATSENAMYGLIGKIQAQPGKRDELIEILLGGTSGMPGCLSYVIARDGQDEDALWVTEVWTDQESHQASLGLESVQQAIAAGRPLIAGFSERFETVPVGAHGLASGDS